MSYSGYNIEVCPHTKPSFQEVCASVCCDNVRDLQALVSDPILSL